MPSSPELFGGSVKTETNWSRKNDNDGRGAKRMNGRSRMEKRRRTTSTRTSHCCCCCPCCGLRCATVVFACLELFIFAYQLIMTTMDMFSSTDQSEDSAFLFFGGSSSPTSTSLPGDTSDDPFLSALPLLPLILLAITVVVLLLLGTVLRAPYLLIPHLLMQLSFFIVNLFLVCYLAFWWKKGVSMQFSAVVYEASEEGEEGLSNANQLSPFETHLTVSQMGSVAGGLTILFAILLVVQLLLILLVFATFLRLLRLSAAHRRVSDESGEEGDTEKCSTAMTQLSSVRTGVSPSASNSANPPQQSTSGGGISTYSNLSVLNNISNASNIRQPNHQQERPQQNIRPRPPVPSPSLRPPSNFVPRNNNNPSLSRSSSLGTRTWASRVPRAQLQVAPVAPIMAPAPVVVPSAETIHPHNYTNTTTIITDRDNTTMEEEEETSEYEELATGALTAMSTHSL